MLSGGSASHSEVPYRPSRTCENQNKLWTVMLLQVRSLLALSAIGWRSSGQICKLFGSSHYKCPTESRWLSISTSKYRPAKSCEIPGKDLQAQLL